MSPRYLYPCPNCDGAISLATKQAGQRVVCPECQTEVDAPKLGLLRQLEPVADSNSRAVNSSKGGLKNWLFVAGLAIAILSGAAGAGLYYYSTGLISRFDIDGSLEHFESEIDQLAESEVVMSFLSLDTTSGLGEWTEHPAIRDSHQGKILQTVSFCLLGLSGIGLLTLVASFFVRP